ncbi:MAG: hypothetical protein AABY07_06410 [Nanoarchaeota archaeon]|mgnify:CR=1 FL=1
MPTETETEGRILVPDEKLQDLFLETVRTLPPFVGVEHAEFRFAADGIESKSLLEDKKKKYLALCKEKRIKPFSRLKVEWSSSARCFVVDHVFGSYPSLEDEISGGRTGVYEVRLESHPQFVDFGSTKGGLDLLISNEYQMMRGELWFGSSRGSCSEGGRLRDGGIDIGTSRWNKGVRLEGIPDDFTEVQKSFFQDWFNRLRTKYERPSAPSSKYENCI